MGSGASSQEYNSGKLGIMESSVQMLYNRELFQLAGSLRVMQSASGSKESKV